MPDTWQAWAWIAAFGLVDGAAFQVSTRDHLCRDTHVRFYNLGSILEGLAWGGLLVWSSYSGPFRA